MSQGYFPLPAKAAVMYHPRGSYVALKAGIWYA
jgi:hypothetical protein